MTVPTGDASGTADRPEVVAIFGATGSGKTEVAVRIAARLGTEVVNCDPAQCYRGLPLLTNQPTAADDAIAAHRLVAVWPLSHTASFPDFVTDAHREIDSLVAANGIAVACGGSGLYLRAATSRLVDASSAPRHDPHLRAELEERWHAPGGRDELHAELVTRDPAVATRVPPTDRIRLVRALEVARRGGSIAPGGASVWDAPTRRPTLVVGLAVERPALRARIDARTTRMFEAGLLGEVAGIVGPTGERADDVLSPTAHRLHGLDDCIGVLRGSHGVARAQELMAARTRQYAKRQETWARRWPGLVLVPAEAGADAVARSILD